MRKKCKDCTEELTLLNSVRRPDGGIRNRCRVCYNAYMNEWRYRRKK